MAIFYFDVEKDGDNEPDVVGTELAHRDLVAGLALDLALQIAREALPGVITIIISVRDIGLEPPLFRARLSLEGVWYR